MKRCTGCRELLPATREFFWKNRYQRETLQSLLFGNTLHDAPEKEVKAITLWQPWAALVADGWKECETRGWYTSYRGPLAIHAAARPADPADISYFTFALAKYGQQMPELLYGVVVATCELAACLPAALVQCKAKQLKLWFEPRHGWEVEKIFGNYKAGRWAWIFRNVRPLEKPATARGAQKLWDWKGEQ